MSVAPLPPKLAQLRMRDLLLLEHLGEVESLSEAAVRMHVTQSAITQALHALEAAFGTRLVVRGQRGQRGIRLTPAGAAALLHLRVARQELAAAQDAPPTTEELAQSVGTLITAVDSVWVAVAAAFVRGKMPEVAILPLDAQIERGLAAGLKLHKFKRQAQLPRRGGQLDARTFAATPAIQVSYEIVNDGGNGEAKSR